MKPSFKTTTLIAAIGMTVYTCYIVVRCIPTVSLCLRSLHGLNRDIFYAFWMAFFLGIIGVTILAIWRHRPTEPIVPKKYFRITTYTLTALISIWAIEALLPSPLHIEGVPYLFIRFPKNLILLTLTTVWLWMLSRQNTIGNISKALRTTMIVGACVLCVPVLFQLVSGISYLLTGQLLFLHSWAVFSWVKICIPIVLLCWYSIELFQNSRK